MNAMIQVSPDLYIPIFRIKRIVKSNTYSNKEEIDEWWRKAGAWINEHPALCDTTFFASNVYAPDGREMRDVISSNVLRSLCMDIGELPKPIESYEYTIYTIDNEAIKCSKEYLDKILNDFEKAMEDRV